MVDLFFSSLFVKQLNSKNLNSDVSTATGR